MNRSARADKDIRRKTSSSGSAVTLAVTEGEELSAYIPRDDGFSDCFWGSESSILHLAIGGAFLLLCYALHVGTPDELTLPLVTDHAATPARVCAVFLLCSVIESEQGAFRGGHLTFDVIV